jgi:hypothetical protein
MFARKSRPFARSQTMPARNTKPLVRSKTVRPSGLMRSSTMPIRRTVPPPPPVPKGGFLKGAFGPQKKKNVRRTVPPAPPVPKGGFLKGSFGPAKKPGAVPPPPPPPKGGFLKGAFGPGAKKPAGAVPPPPPPPPKGGFLKGSFAKPGAVPPPPPPPPKGGFLKGLFGGGSKNKTAVKNNVRRRMILPTPNNKKSKLLNELRAKTQKTRNQLNQNARQSAGGNFQSGVQRVEKNQVKIQAAGAQNRMIEELKRRFASKGNKEALAHIGRLAPGLMPVPYKRGIRNFDRTKQILINAKGRPFIVFIPSQMRNQNKEILSNDRLRPSLLDMRFLKRSQNPNTAVFGDGYYNARFFGLGGVQPTVPIVPFQQPMVPNQPPNQPNLPIVPVQQPMNVPMVPNQPNLPIVPVQQPMNVPMVPNQPNLPIVPVQQPHSTLPKPNQM